MLVMIFRDDFDGKEGGCGDSGGEQIVFQSLCFFNLIVLGMEELFNFGFSNNRLKVEVRSNDLMEFN